MLNYSIINANGTACVTLFVPGADTPIYTADDTNPAFTDIVAALLEGKQSAEDIAPLFDPETAAKVKFQRTSVSERIAVKNGQVYFDGTPVDSALTRQMIRLMDEGVSDWEGLARFMEKVETNPNEHSRTQLYEWLRRHDLAINQEGDAIFYKGVQANGDGTYVSVHSGPAIVNGVEVNGQVPNNPGDVVEMDRSKVMHDPARGCASGLHVANWRYAESWARGAVLKVVVNPRDVVSVPTDCNWEKIRCSRYKVIEVITAPVNTAYLPLDGVDTPDLPGNPADFDLSNPGDVSGGVGVGATARMGMGGSLHITSNARDYGGRPSRRTTQVANRSAVGGRSDGRKHGKGGATSQAAKGSGRNPAQDAKGRFSTGRPGSGRDPKTGRFA